jgi:hypothetical protein
VSTQPCLTRADAEPKHRSSADIARGRAGAFARRLAALTLAVAAFGVSAEALAQDQVWLKDRRYTEGAGIRVGDFEVHPGVAAELGYDSNYLRAADSEDPGGAFRIRITPSLSLSTLGPQRTEGVASTPPPDVEFRGTAALTYNEFIGVNGTPSAQRKVGDQRNISGNLDLNLTIRPRQEWSGGLFAGVGRTTQPSDTGALGSFAGLFDRFLVRAGGELIWTPGAGLLDWRLGYRLSGTIFQEVAGLTNLEHTIQTRGRWRFLPRTALLYDARLGFVNYVNGDEKRGSHPLRVQLGLNGLITPSFGVLVMGGWGASFYDARTANGEVHNFDSFIGQAELKWYLTPNPATNPGAATLSVSSVSLGFTRDFQDSYIGSYVERDRGYASLSYFFSGRVLTVVEGNVGPAVYPRIPQGESGVVVDTAPWTDIRYEASIFAEYRLRDYFGINATLRYGGNASGTTIAVQGGGGDSLQWQAFEAYLGARFML